MSRTRPQPRQIEIYVDPNQLVRWLNENADTGRYKRVLSLLHDVCAVMGHFAGSGTTATQARKLLASINQRLSGYMLLTAIGPPLKPGGPITLSWKSAHPIRDPKRLAAAHEEFVSVLSVVILAANRDLRHVRQCKLEECRRWMYSARDTKVFCSVLHQQKFYRSSPEWKKQRAEWMQRYRQIKQMANIK